MRAGGPIRDADRSANALKHGADAQAGGEHPVVERIARLVRAQVGGGGGERRRATASGVHRDAGPARILHEPAERVGCVDVDGLAPCDDEDRLAVGPLDVDGGLRLVDQHVLEAVALLYAVRPTAPVLEGGAARAGRHRDCLAAPYDVVPWVLPSSHTRYCPLSLA